MGLHLIQSAEAEASSLDLHREELWAASNSGRGALPSITGLTEAQTGQEGHEQLVFTMVISNCSGQEVFIFYFYFDYLFYM